MRNSEKQPPVQRTCHRCNKNFLIWASLLRHGKAGKWCSRECFLADSRVTVTCDTCKSQFVRQKKTASRYANGKNFCSRECSNKARRKNPDRIALKRLRYGNTEFLHKRQEVIERDGFCQICEDSCANSIHHIDWNPYNNSIDNLILLCKKCHGRLRRFEDWVVAKGRIVACSGLIGNYESPTEMIGPDEDYRQ